MNDFNPAKVNFRMATLNDLDSITRIHCASFSPENSIPVLLGENYVKATYKWHIKYPEAYVLVAELDGEIVGFSGICDRPYFKPMFMACFGELVISLIKKPGLLFDKGMWKRFSLRSFLFERSTKNLYSDVAQLTDGAVDINFRRSSILRNMMDRHLSINKNRGSKAIRVGVYKSNLAIRQFFIKSGWIEIPDLETPETMHFITFLDPLFQEEFFLD